MKLLRITKNFTPISCDVGDYTYRLATEFVNQRNEVSVICRTDKCISEYWSKTNKYIAVYDKGGSW